MHGSSVDASALPWMRIRLLGGFSVWINGRPVLDDQWRSRRARNLVKLLALSPAHRAHRDQIIDTLWPDSDLSAAANNFHQTLHAARKIMGVDCLALEEGLLRLAADGADLAVDVEAFEAAAGRAFKSRDLADVQAALEHYTGDLLPDDLYEEWTITRRESLRQAYLKLLLEAAQQYERCADYPAGIAALQRLLSSDPAHEEAHLALMRLYALNGQRQAALRQFQALGEALRAELEAEPGESAARLYREIQSGAFPAPSGLPSSPVPAPSPATTQQAHNLPAQLTSFIGREGEIEEVCHLIRERRLVTLSGAGGVGKTRLALAAAEALLAQFPQGVWLVELAPLSDPALVPGAVAAALGLHEIPGRDAAQMLVEYLSARRALLLLDNCEHVIDAAARLAVQLLQGCPRLKILATSREILGTGGETAYRVPSLELPGEPGESAEALTECESVRLFVERARSARLNFDLTGANAALVARICRRLDGIPLAIELAAARARLLSIEQIAARLDDSFTLLTGGSRTVLSRHQTLRALIDWSYDLLSQPEQLMFVRLSVFAGGFSLEAAEHVCSDLQTGEDRGGALGPDAILDLLTQLVDKSLVIPLAAAEGTGEPHYRLLETIRQYAREKLHEIGSEGSVRDRHLAFYMLLAEEAEPYLRRGDQIAWLNRLDTELDNLRLALEWSLTRRVNEGLRLAVSLLWFWHIRSHGREGIAWLERLQEAGKNAGEAGAEVHPLVRARALVVAGFLYWFQPHLERAAPLLEQAVALLQAQGAEGETWLGIALLFLSKTATGARRAALLEECRPLLEKSGDPLYLAEYAMDRGGVLVDQHRIEEAEAAFEESKALREKAEDLDGLGTACMMLGDMALFHNDFDGCRRHYDYSLSCFKTVKNALMQTVLLARLGNTEMLTGHFLQAADRFAAGITISRATGDQVGTINLLFSLGRLDLNLGNYVQASQHFDELVSAGLEYGLRRVVIVGLLYQGWAAQEMGDEQRAREFSQKFIETWRANQETFDPISAAPYLEYLSALMTERFPELAVKLHSAVEHSGLLTHRSETPIETAAIENSQRAARRLLGEERFAAAQAEGQRMTIEEVLQMALNLNL